MILERTEAYEKARFGTFVLYYNLEKPVPKATQKLFWSPWLEETFPFVSGVATVYEGYIVTGFDVKDVSEQQDEIMEWLKLGGEQITPMEEAHNEN